jgi:hypothetical protein
MSEITQADRDAVKAYYVETGFVADQKGLEQAFARHRMEAMKALSAENERLREALKEVFEAWAGSEGFIPETAPEGYLLYLTKRMAHIARAALGEQQ